MQELQPLLMSVLDPSTVRGPRNKHVTKCCHHDPVFDPTPVSQDAYGRLDKRSKSLAQYVCIGHHEHTSDEKSRYSDVGRKRHNKWGVIPSIAGPGNAQHEQQREDPVAYPPSY